MGMRRRWAVTLAAGLSVGGAGARATTYYVDSAGSDRAAGNLAAPWRTVQQAANVAGAGDTVYLRGGTYSGRVNVMHSGLAGQPLSFQAYPGESVTLDAGGHGTVFNTNGRNYLQISGLAVQNTGNSGQGILVDDSQHVTVTHCATSNTYDSGIMVRNSSYVDVLHNDIHGACRGGEETLSIKISSYVNAGYNTIHDTGHEGIDVKEGAQHVQVYNNTLWNVERQALYTDAWNRPTADIQFYNNVMHDCLFGVSIGSETGGQLSNVRVYNNVIYDMPGPGLSVQDWGDAASAHPIADVVLTNNTVYNVGNQWGGAVLLENSEAAGVTVRNNVFAAVAYPVQTSHAPSDLVIDHNLIESARGVQPGWGTIGSATFADLAARDLRLMAGSLGVDAGSSEGVPLLDALGVARPQGLGIDIGAYEFTPVPEPATLALLAAGAGLRIRRRR